MDQQTEQRSLSISEQAKAVSEVLRETLPQVSEERRPLETRPEQRPADIETVSRHGQWHNQAAASLAQQYEDLRAQAAVLQREYDKLGPLMAVDPVAGLKRRAAIAEAAAALEEAGGIYQQRCAQVAELGLDATAFAIWGNDEQRKERELPQLVAWAQANLIHDSVIDLLARTPAIARLMYKAWLYDQGHGRARPPVQAVPRTDGRARPRNVPQHGQSQLDQVNSILRDAGVTR
jgi:hypothetical protein